MDLEYDEDYIESSDGDWENEFELDEIRSELHSDVDTAVPRLRDMATNKDSAFASEAAVELLRVDSSLESLHILISSLALSDSYQNLNALESAWSHFKRGKQGDYLAECIKEVLPNVEGQPRLNMKLRCILTSTYLQLNLIEAARTELDSLTKEISSVDAVWKDSTQQNILILAVQVCAMSAHSSIDEFIVLKRRMEELDQCLVGGVVLDSSQNQTLNEIKAALATRAHDLEKAHECLAAALNGSDSNTTYTLFILISLCLGQSPRQTRFETKPTQVQATNELISAWNSQDTIGLKRILAELKIQLTNDHVVLLGCAEAIDIAWKVYREQCLLKLLKFYRRIKFADILLKLPHVFDTVNELQQNIAYMIRRNKLNGFKMNIVDQSLDSVPLKAANSSSVLVQTNRNVEQRNRNNPQKDEDQVSMPSAYSSLANPGTTRVEIPPGNNLDEALTEALSRHKTIVSLRH